MSPQFLALVTSFFYAGCFLATRRGLVYSTPSTAAYVALAVNTSILCTIVFLPGGIPDVPLVATLCFVAGGWIQLGTRLFAYHGVARLGASVTSTVQSTNPLFGTALAVLFLHETVTPMLLSGTGAVVLGIVLLSWNPQQQKTYRTWELIFPFAAALTAGVNHPIRRYGLTIANEPLFLSAISSAAGPGKASCSTGGPCLTSWSRECSRRWGSGRWWRRWASATWWWWAPSCVSRRCGCSWAPLCSPGTSSR